MAWPFTYLKGSRKKPKWDFGSLPHKSACFLYLVNKLEGQLHWLQFNIAQFLSAGFEKQIQNTRSVHKWCWDWKGSPVSFLGFIFLLLVQTKGISNILRKVNKMVLPPLPFYMATWSIFCLRVPPGAGKMDCCFSAATQSSCRGLSYSKSGTASWELGTDGSSLTKPLNTSTKCGQRYMFLNMTAPNPCIPDNSAARAVTTVGFLTSLPQMCSWSSLQELSPNRCGGNKGRTAGLHQCSSQYVVVPK